MSQIPIHTPLLVFEPNNWFLTGKEVNTSLKTIGQLKGVFIDENSRIAMNQDLPVYSVQTFQPSDDSAPGGLSIGNTTIYPGKVGNEFFMTRGHLHAKADRTEFYWGVNGNGLILLMNNDGDCRVEKMFAGSIHYIDRFHAHRVVNTGSVPLSFGACWPSDAGHNYEIIEQLGFTTRVMDSKHGPVLI